MNDWITTTKQSTTKPCAYFLGYTVLTAKLSACTQHKPSGLLRMVNQITRLPANAHPSNCYGPHTNASHRFYIWHCVPNILLWSILCKTVGLPSSTGESERTARRQFHSPTLRCFRGRLCEVAAGRGPLKQSRWPESFWTLPLRSVGVAPSLGRFWLVFTAIRLRYVLRRHIILSDSDGNQGVLDCFTVYPGLGGSAKWFYVACCDGS